MYLMVKRGSQPLSGSQSLWRPILEKHSEFIMNSIFFCLRERGDREQYLVLWSPDAGPPVAEDAKET